ncbi:MAG: hypothetical protein JSR24_12545 [Proteobacteria bacterium]|nr:hypothetical protein [Pseudomonadota bacterium]
MKKLAILTLILGALVAGCGSGASSESPQETTTEPTKATKGAVPSEAESLATGDIPDNQEFLTYTDKPAGYSIKYPAGWARTGDGAEVTFREKGNLIHVAVHPGTAKSAEGEKKTFTRKSTPDPVTGKSVPLLVDVYEYEKGGKVAVLELSTPEGVDNVDAYRMISESFQWR